MADSPSPILLLRIQTTGSNINLWGGYINTALETLEQASKGYQTLAVTGNATIAWANYTLANSGQCAMLKLTGSLSSSAVLTFPNYDNELVAWNASGATVTIMCSGGTGVAIPNGRKARIYCDGTDYYSSTPDWTGDSYTLTNGGDLVTNTQLAAAIAAIVGGSDGLVLTSTSATVRQYLNVGLIITANGGLSLTKINGGTSSEAISAALDINGMSPSTNIAAADTFPFYDSTASAVKKQTRSNIVGKFGLVLQASSATVAITAGSLWSVDCTAGAGAVTFPASASVGDIFGLAIFGANGCVVSTNSLNYYGTAFSALQVNGQGLTFFEYTGATVGWIDT